MDVCRSSGSISPSVTSPRALGTDAATACVPNGKLLCRAALRALAGTLAACFVVALSAGCDDDSNGSAVQSDLQNRDLASIDARGGNMEVLSLLQPSNFPGGTAGNGGEVRITSSRGDVFIGPTAVAVAPLTPLAVGKGLDVWPGRVVRVSGLQVVDFVRVQRGGRLEIDEDALFQVTGDVEIAGVVQSIPSNSSSDGHDLTIDAGGIINVTGRIDCSGRDNVLSEDLAGEDSFLAGGAGGDVFLFSHALNLNPVGPHVFISGVIDAGGGTADEVFSNRTLVRGGRGGEILVGTDGSMAINGKLIVRGGVASLNDQLLYPDGGGANGGLIGLTAMDDIFIGQVLQINASAGSSAGSFGGWGGSITLEAPIGTVALDSFAVLARGGDITFSEDGIAGRAGEITVFGDRVLMAGMLVDATGGGVGQDSAQDGFDVTGIGDRAGEIQIAALTQMDFDDGTRIAAVGGATNQDLLPGGTGGDVRFVNINESNLSVIDFLGTVDARAGTDAAGNLGDHGTICYRGASADAVDRITGANDFPISQCALTAAGSVADARFVSHDLDCDPGTIMPDVISAEIPTATGVDFYRVRVGGATSVTISTRGAPTGDIDIYAGDDSTIGSLNFADYQFSSTNANTSEENITINLGNFTPGNYVSVLVVEMAAFTEEYSVTVGCQ